MTLPAFLRDTQFSMQKTLFVYSVWGLATYAAFRGMGLPNHPYQLGVAALVLFISYHQRALARPKSGWDWGLVFGNGLLIAMISKLLIGGGVRAPFAWLSLPTPTATMESWLPKWGIAWVTLPLTEWQLDLTLVQSYLLIATSVGAWVRFQPFASVMLMALMVVSLPSYVDFDWHWCLPALAFSCVHFYVQRHWVAAVPTRSRA
jgi:hypothetical protein